VREVGVIMNDSWKRAKDGLQAPTSLRFTLEQKFRNDMKFRNVAAGGASKGQKHASVSSDYN
jgi:hypothetical protein